MRILLSTTALLLRPTASAFLHRQSPMFAASRAMSSAAATDNKTALNAKPFSVIVEAEIDESRMDEFLKMIENNAIETRKEPGCIRFDVLRDQGKPNKFFFYEVYENMEAVDFHKTQPHYNAWAEFKASGGTVSSVSHKADGEFMT